MSTDNPKKKRILEGIDIIVDESKKAAREAIRRSGAESLGENLKETVQGALSARDNVVMVRLNGESVARLDELVEAGVVGSRSESAAFLIAEGIKARSDLFEKISAKVKEIQKAKEDLRRLLAEDSSDDPN